MSRFPVIAIRMLIARMAQDELVSWFTDEMRKSGQVGTDIATVIVTIVEVYCFSSIFFLYFA